MRFTTFASAAVLALSTAAIAQVGQSPEEQKLSNNAAVPDETARPAPTPAASNTPAPEPGTPSTALVNSASGQPAAPVGNQPPK